MKLAILLSILFELFSRRRLTAAYLSKKHAISPRTVYRYVEILATCVPVYVKKGRGGGICLSDCYKLPTGLLEAGEYDATVNALVEAYSRTPSAQLLNAKRKLTAQKKEDKRLLAISGDVGSLVVCGDAWGDTRIFSEKLHLVECCLKEREVLQIAYADDGESFFKIEPHVLLLKGGGWQVYAFCHKQRKFRIFALRKIHGVFRTEESFRRRPFKREDLPLSIAVETDSVEVRLTVKETARERVENLLGVECRCGKDGLYADVTFANNDELPLRILSLGTGVEVISPVSLREKLAEKLARYNQLYK